MTKKQLYFLKKKKKLFINKELQRWKKFKSFIFEWKILLVNLKNIPTKQKGFFQKKSFQGLLNYFLLKYFFWIKFSEKSNENHSLTKEIFSFSFINKNSCFDLFLFSNFSNFYWLHSYYFFSKIFKKAWKIPKSDGKKWINFIEFSFLF